MQTNQTQDCKPYWAALLPVFIEDFIELCMPTMYPHIDFSYTPQFIEEQLKVLEEDDLGKDDRSLKRYKHRYIVFKNT